MFTQSLRLSKFKILDGSCLKLIALISMLIDHTAAMLVPALPLLRESIFSILGKQITVYYIMRKVGRLAFPIFCFLISEGFYHTRNRIKYSLNLFIFALISELPYNLLCTCGKSVFLANKQNVFFTLLLGTIVLHIFESNIHILAKVFTIIGIVITSGFLHIDYGSTGVILIFMLYLLRENSLAQTIIAKPLLSGGYFAWSAFIFINMYNGKRGFIRGKLFKYAFYAFYPVHIFILYIILKIIQN